MMTYTTPNEKSNTTDTIHYEHVTEMSRTEASYIIQGLSKCLEPSYPESIGITENDNES